MDSDDTYPPTVTQDEAVAELRRLRRALGRIETTIEQRDTVIRLARKAGLGPVAISEFSGIPRSTVYNVLGREPA